MITKFLIFNLQQNCRCIQWPGFSIVLWIQCKVLYVSLQWLSLISGTKLLEINKHSTWIDALYKNATWIDVLSVFRVFWTPHFYICHFLSRYRGICYLPIFPSCRKWSWTAGENGIKMSKVQDRMLSNQKIKRVPFPIAMPRGVRVLIEVSSVYSFYVNLFIYLFFISLL